MAFKCMSGQAPCYFSDKFATKKLSIKRPFVKSSAGQRIFYYRMMHIRNNLDNTLKTTKQRTF